MVLLEKTRVSQKCVSKTGLVQVFVYQRGVQEYIQVQNHVERALGLNMISRKAASLRV